MGRTELNKSSIEYLERETMARKLLVGIVFLTLLITSAGYGGAQVESEKPKIVKFMDWYPEPAETLEKFHSSQDKILVEWEQVSSNEYINVLNTRLMSGEPPEIFGVRNATIYEQLVKDNKLVELSGRSFINNYKDDILERSKAADGRIYGITIAPVSLLGYYNKTLFDAHGLNRFTCWEEYLEVCEALKNSGAIPHVQGAKQLSDAGFIVDEVKAMWIKDKNWVNGITTGESRYTEPEVIEVVQRLQTVAEKGYLHPGILSMDQQQAWLVYCEGNIGMMTGGSWFAGRWFPQAQPSFEWGMYNRPDNLHSLGQPSLMATAVRVQIRVVPKDAPNSAEALTFLEWLSKPENESVLCKDFGCESSVKGVQAGTTPIEKKIFAYAAQQQTMPNVEPPAEIATDRLKIFQSIIGLTKTAEEACIELQNKINAVYGLK